MKNPKEKILSTLTEKRPASPSSSVKNAKPPFRPLPGQPISLSPEGEASSIGSPASDEGVLIDDEVAGELANALPTLINIFEPAWEVMNEAQMAKIGRALRIYLEKKYDKRELKHPELLLVVAGYSYVFQQAKNVRKAMVERKKAKVNAPDDSRPKRDGKDVPGVVGGEAV